MENRRAFVFYLIALIGAIQVNAQQIQLMYQDSFGPSEGEFLAYADELPSKNIMVMGGKRASVDPFSNFEPLNYYLACIDSNLNLKWEMEIGSPYYSEYFQGAIKTSGGSYIVAGTREDPPNWTISSPELLCIDSGGNVLWQQYYDIAYDCALMRICKYPNGNVLLAVNVRTGLLNQAPAYVLVDEQGNEIWRTNPDTSLEDYSINYISPCSDGGFVIEGITPFPTSNFTDPPFIAKYNSTGNVEWVKYPYGTDDTVYYKVGGVFCKDDGTIIALFPDQSGAEGYERTYWKEYDLNGNFLREYALPFYLFADAGMGCILPVSIDNNKMIAITRPYNGSGSWMLPFDLDRKWGQGIHYMGSDSVRSTHGFGFGYGIQLRDGGYFGVGVAWDAINYPTQPGQFYFVRFARDGRYQTQDYSTTVTINPNPSPDGNFTFEFDAQKDETVEINIWSTTGQIVYTTSVFCPAGYQMDLAVSLERESCPSGTYFFEATTSETTMRKILIIARSED